MGIRFSLTALVATALLCPAQNFAGPLIRAEPLDSLAARISRLGRIPQGGMFGVLAASCGWPGAVNGVQLLPGDSPELRSLLNQPREQPSYYGLSRWSSGGDVVVVTAPSQECVPLSVPDAVSPGDSVIIELRGYDDLCKPVAALGSPSLDTFVLHPDTAGRIGFLLPDPGVYWVEVMQHTVGGPVVEILFPIVSGGTYNDVLEGRIPLLMSNAGSPEEILEELNFLRTARGMEPLIRDADLDEAAAERAGNLALLGSLDHIDREAGSLEEEIPSWVSLFGENIGRGNGYQEAWSMILISPMHLMTCMSPDYDRIGLAGSVDCTSYQWQLVLVQVFASAMDGS